MIHATLLRSVPPEIGTTSIAGAGTWLATARLPLLPRLACSGLAVLIGVLANIGAYYHTGPHSTVTFIGAAICFGIEALIYLRCISTKKT